MTDAPERITVSVIDQGGGFRSVSVDDDGAATPYEAEYIRADLAQAANQRARDQALEDAAKEAETEGWNADAPRLGYSEREEGSRDCAERIAAAIRAMKGDTDAGE